MDSRHTRQKQVIMDTLKKDKSHPTVLELYKKVLETDPNVGQATVYRNVKRLVEEGTIKKISTRTSGDHYDANCSDHHHFVCKRCGKIYDIFDISLARYLKQIEMMYWVEVEECQVLFNGICHECMRRARDEFLKNKKY